MRNGKRGGYRLEFKQEAVRVVESGQSLAEAARSSGSGGTDAVELGEGASGRAAERGRRQGRGDRGADGDQSSAGRAGAGEDGARHPGKSDGVVRERPEVRYAFIERHRRIWPICVQCRVLRVSVSGFHQHRARRRRIAERRHWSDQARLTHSSAVYAEHIAGPAAGRASGGS